MIPVAFAGCLGWLHPAAGGRGVVLCPPWGFEALCAYRAFFETAQALAAAGLPCLRLDLPGSGDSLDPPSGAALLDRWIEALLEAVALLLARTGVREVALVGLRLGALLASETAIRLGGVARLGLLAPPASGRIYARELRAWARLASGEPARPGAAVGVDGIVAGGFTLDASTLAALARFDPLSGPHPPAHRVLILERGEGAPVAGALGAWARQGVTIEAAPFEGYAELMRDPLLSKPPRAAIARLVRFLAEAMPPSTEPFLAIAAAPSEAVLEGPGFVQRTLRFGPGGRLVGTWTEPAIPETRRGRPALLVLNTGATHRVGAGRSAVELARALAVEGVASLRLDLGGIGDSELAPGEPLGDVYRRGTLADVRAALDRIESLGSTGVVGLGVCSGAFVAFHAALADPRLVGLVLVNLPRFARRPFHPLVFVRTGALLALLARPATWRRGLVDRSELRAALRILAERLAARLAASSPKRLRRVAVALSAPARALRALMRRGVRLLVVYSGDDPGLPLFDRVIGGGRGRLADGRLEIRVVEGADHAFCAPASRAVLFDLVRRHLERHRPFRASERAAFGCAASVGSRTGGPIGSRHGPARAGRGLGRGDLVGRGGGPDPPESSSEHRGFTPLSVGASQPGGLRAEG